MTDNDIENNAEEIKEVPTTDNNEEIANLKAMATRYDHRSMQQIFLFIVLLSLLSYIIGVF